MYYILRLQNYFHNTAISSSFSVSAALIEYLFCRPKTNAEYKKMFYKPLYFTCESFSKLKMKFFNNSSLSLFIDVFFSEYTEYIPNSIYFSFGTYLSN